MIRVLLLLTLLLTFTGLSGCGKSLVFFPMKPWVQNPLNVGVAYEDIVIIHPRGLRLHGWWLPAKDGTENARGTVYFLHGNAQNISTHIGSVYWLPEQGFNVFLLDYRGYGLSDGKPVLPDVLDDIQLGLNWLDTGRRSKGKPIIVFGQSLGASMSVPVLSQADNQSRYTCAILEAGFTGYRDIASDVMKQHWLTWPLRPFVIPGMPKHIDPVDHIGSIRNPLLVMHSKEDEVIPFTHAEALFAAASDPKQFQPLLGNHIAAIKDSGVRARFMSFVSEQCGLKKAPARPTSVPVPVPEPEEVKPKAIEPKGISF